MHVFCPPGNPGPGWSKDWNVKIQEMILPSHHNTFRWHNIWCLAVNESSHSHSFLFPNIKMLGFPTFMCNNGGGGRFLQTWQYLPVKTALLGQLSALVVGTDIAPACNQHTMRNDLLCFVLKIGTGGKYTNMATPPPTQVFLSCVIISSSSQGTLLSAPQSLLPCCLHELHVPCRRTSA